MIRKILTAILLLPTLLYAQINTERVMTIARNALYFEDYVLSIQYFNQVINAKPIYMSLISSVDWQKSIWMTIRERRVIVMLRFKEILLW